MMDIVGARMYSFSFGLARREEAEAEAEAVWRSQIRGRGEETR